MAVCKGTRQGRNRNTMPYGCPSCGNVGSNQNGCSNQGFNINSKCSKCGKFGKDVAR